MKWFELCNEYLNYFKSYYKITSYDSKLRRFKLHVYNLSDKDIDEISSTDIYKFVLDIKNTISISRANKILSDIKLVYKYYSTFHKYNSEADKVKQFKDYSIIESIENKTISIDELNKFFKSFSSKEYKYKLLFTFTLLAGTRFGEVCGLQVKCLNFDSCTVFINKQLQYISSEHTYKLVCPKSRKSVRLIYLPKQFMILLKNYINKNNLTNDDFVFFGKNKNTFITKTVVYNKLKNHLEENNIKIFNFHTFRKIKASLMLDYGLSNSLIINTLGHESINTTYQHYYLQSKESLSQITSFENDLFKKILK